jgi:acyl-CoA reductase-like NAD-dependent aldehyde dehydrogenase
MTAAEKARKRAPNDARCAWRKMDAAQRAEFLNENTELRALATSFADVIVDHLGDDPYEWESYEAAVKSLGRFA